MGVEESQFSCLKLRTMRVGAEGEQHDLEEHNEADGALFKMRKDPRVTRVGAFLRRFSLDELPQLWNVLRGEMSLVGPRPLPLRDYERLDDLHKKRYLVLPGITGLWQVAAAAALVRRAGAARLLLHRVLVDLARPHDPGHDDPGCPGPPGGLLSAGRPTVRRARPGRAAAAAPARGRRPAACPRCACRAPPSARRRRRRGLVSRVRGGRCCA